MDSRAPRKLFVGDAGGRCFAIDIKSGKKITKFKKGSH
jgi:hypothetical protein